MNRLLPSTSARLALLVMGGFLASFVVIGAGVYLAVSSLLEKDVRDLVRADAVTLVDTYRDSGLAGLRDELQARIHGDDGDPDAVYALTDAGGTAVVGRRPDARVPGPRGHWLQFTEDAPETGARLRVLAFEQRLPGGQVLLTGQRLQSQDRLLALMQQAAALAFVIATALGGLVGWLTSRWVARRLRSLDATAARVGAGELALRVPLDDSNDAFDRLAHRFNAMLDRIEDLLGGVRHATDHIAHDLRTPLTRLRNRLEDARAHCDDPGLRPRLERALAETDQLLQAFSSLLRLARIESSAIHADAQPVAIDALVADAVELYAPVAAERGITVDVCLQPAQVRGDRDQLFQLVVNLLDNALKYAPAGGCIVVGTDGDDGGMGVDGCVHLVVVDDGPGIPASERARVFDRFQRLEAHRGTPGNGLGLSLVRAIALHHGGTVTLADNAPGLRVEVLLPGA